ncbi:MAG: hypothetical protein Q9M43_09685 [Sulfurimonas sp.]|nr:hypothetical protein [Sulfurimonas sp.]
MNFQSLIFLIISIPLKKAIEELGVDLELMNQLIDDFVIQIVKESTTFNEFLEELQDLQTYTKKSRLHYFKRVGT